METREPRGTNSKTISRGNTPTQDERVIHPFQNQVAPPPDTHQDGYYKTKTRQHRKQHVLMKMQRNWNPCALLVGMDNGTATVENNMAVPKKIEHRIII